jgi:choline dehydrogenase-like flavoprotein
VILETVLVVEYGPLADDNSVILPLKLITFAPPMYMWNITSAPQKWLDNRTFAVLGGAVVGGGSAVNAMMLFRGSQSDYDNWEKLGNEGWGWEGMLPYFRKVCFQFLPDIL